LIKGGGAELGELRKKAKDRKGGDKIDLRRKGEWAGRLLSSRQAAQKEVRRRGGEKGYVLKQKVKWEEKCNKGQERKDRNERFNFGEVATAIKGE